ncbi:MAG: plasmid recombination protein [Eubacterium sp.]|nr:plasmid recombination protein [Eubacterium sp.]
MKRTISVMVGKGSINHNSRKFKAANVDGERSHLNIDYCNEDIKQVYHELFDEALKRYNEKQTRSDRVISDYYEKIRSGKQERLFHEIILQIGDKDNMSAVTEDGQLAKKILNEYYKGFQERNPNLRVFSAHLHMDEATPHLHIDFVPFTTGSKRGLDTRVSLKQALATQGFKGGTRNETEWNQWVQSEKEQLAAVMERRDIEWEHKGTHEKHLSVLDFEKKMRSEEVAELDAEILDKKKEYNDVAKRLNGIEHVDKTVEEIEQILETDERYDLPEPSVMMSAKGYKNKVVEPLIERLKSLVKAMTAKYFAVKEENNKFKQIIEKQNSQIQGLRNVNEKFSAENIKLKKECKDYFLLRKVFGDTQIDSLLKQAKNMQKSVQLDKCLGNNRR